MTRRSRFIPTLLVACVALTGCSEVRSVARSFGWGASGQAPAQRVPDAPQTPFERPAADGVRLETDAGEREVPYAQIESAVVQVELNRLPAEPADDEQE